MDVKDFRVYPENNHLISCSQIYFIQSRSTQSLNIGTRLIR